MELVLDIIEAREGIVFVSGYVLQAGSLGDELTTLTVWQPANKAKQAPKCLSTIDLSLTLANIIVAGESLDSIQGDNTAQIGLTGDADALLALLKDHNWHESKGRYHLPRNETRMITLSGA